MTVQDVVASLVRISIEVLLIIWLYAETGFLSITVIIILMTIGYECNFLINTITRQAERELNRTVKNFFKE